jgi:membrane protein DedA with SNARE-associated domain
MEQWIHAIFSQYAYSPWHVYGAICLFMVLSAFGMPIPEEVILVGAGFVGYFALHPEAASMPPPVGGTPVNVYVMAAVAFGAVVASDFLIYYLGHRFGKKILRKGFFKKMISEESLTRAESWMQKYGYWTVILFRFTPGVRFPGHLLCGAMSLAPWKFILVDAIAAGLSVPTQILLVSHYGDFILTYFKRFKIVLITVLVIAVIIFGISKLRQRMLSKR